MECLDLRQSAKVNDLKDRIRVTFYLSVGFYI